MIRVGVVGAAGRMGREVCRAVEADPGTALAAAVDLGDPRERLLDAGVDVVVDFTVLEASRETLAFAGVVRRPPHKIRREPARRRKNSG